MFSHEEKRVRYAFSFYFYEEKREEIYDLQIGKHQLAKIYDFQNTQIKNSKHQFIFDFYLFGKWSQNLTILKYRGNNTQYLQTSTSSIIHLIITSHTAIFFFFFFCAIRHANLFLE